MANTQLSKTFSSAGNRKIYTISVWIKLGEIDSGNDDNTIIGAVASEGNNAEDGLFIKAHQLRFVLNNSSDADLKTNRLLRDCNSWYHIVVAVDTTQSTASDRIKIYINGVQETSFATSNYPSQNYNCNLTNNVFHGIGYVNDGSGSAAYFDGLMSHFHLVDGSALAPTVFGSTDSTTGEWKINTSPSYTVGTNGFFILKDGNSVTDQSANSNNFTVAGGTLTKTEDNPSNVFAVNNRLASSGITISFGNTSAYKAGSGWNNVSSTLGASTGKYYAECKVNGVGSNGVGIGFINLDKSNLQNQSLQGGEDNFSAGIYSYNGAIYYSGGTAWKTVGALSNGDIVQLAMDLDNGFLYWGKNGTWFDSANPASGATGTGGFAISNLSSGGTYAFNSSVRNGGDLRWNYGNGYFEVTAVSSAGTNASGNGIFEYDCPAGFTALSTKGLNL